MLSSRYVPFYGYVSHGVTVCRCGSRGRPDFGDCTSDGFKAHLLSQLLLPSHRLTTNPGPGLFFDWAWESSRRWDSCVCLCVFLYTHGRIECICFEIRTPTSQPGCRHKKPGSNSNELCAREAAMPIRESELTSLSCASTRAFPCPIEKKARKPPPSQGGKSKVFLSSAEIRCQTINPFLYP